MVQRNLSVFAIMPQYHSAPIATRNIDPPRRPDRRSKNKIIDPFKSDRFAFRLASRWFEPRKNVLIVPEKIKRVVVEQGRRDVRCQPIQFPGHSVSARKV